MLSIQDINGAILAGGFTNDQLSSIIDAVKFARSQVAAKTKRQLIVAGTVNKIAIKYVTVNTQQGMWKVPANMLEVA